jgi:dTDP-4-amino-4,6-dideoxygalactose transaminase
MHASIREEMLIAMTRVYDSGWYILGEEVTKFEEAYSAFTQTAYTIGVGNGLEALTLALRAVGVRPGDEVIVPANTYIATWLAVSHVGATPVPVEPELHTSNINPSRIAEAITPLTRAIIPVHLYGQACRMPEIMALAQQHDLRVIEDNAQAQGAAFNGRPTGSFGNVSATSFYPTKNLGALGDAGAVTTNSDTYSKQMRLLRNYGSTIKNQHEINGYNSRLDELQAALLSIKLTQLPQWTAQRQQIATWYTKHLADIPMIRLPAIADGASHVYHAYVVHVPQREALRQHLNMQGVETLVHYPVPPYRQAAYAELKLLSGILPITEELAATCLSLPIWPGMTEDMVTNIGEAIRNFDALRRSIY